MIKAYGLSDLNTGLLNAIPYFCAAVAMVAWGAHSDRRRERVRHVALPLLLAGAGLAGCVFLGALPLKLACLCLTLIGCFSVKPPFWAFAFEALPPGYGTVAVAQINSMAILTGLVGPWAIGWLRQASGSFTLALVPLLALAFISGLTALRLKPQPA
jgi:ACS family tartrate transporter-like MFS transporter